ncbi:hypothetical protein HDIA_0804 [Hartmannibacter diazotrophicus]|uniref:Resolvase/invertase-type recombinase catalytic domain-containing protein n=1 Tax=Hartmannibacter diazotrophicus TaxID=1482074 RepID=A0A2C9D4D0_9HYPH|nr:recombinase family protein [Hartmannibacter diazotrophicus]SON54345.1 hypothetical protein HDIA_0804 [Hartmannibacter diazotrophicus]
MRATRQAIGYTRVSTIGQDDGAGRLLQEESIRAYASATKRTIVEIFTDTHTGAGKDSLSSRPGAQAAIEMAKELGVPIIVDGLDRFSRHTSTLEEFIRNSGVELISARDGERVDKAVIMARSRRAQQERDNISSKTKSALADIKKRGVRLGNPTNLDEAQRLGAARNSEKADEVARNLLPVVRDLKEKGFRTMRQIADQLNRMGYRSPRGMPWTAATIRRPLDRIVILEAKRPSPAPSEASDVRLADDKSNEADLQDEIARQIALNPNWGRF